MVAKSKDTKIKVKAANGVRFPIYYCGSIIKIDDKKSQELDLSLMEYEPKIQLEEGLSKKQLIQTGD